MPIAYDFTPERYEAIALTKVFILELVPAFRPKAQSLGHEPYSNFLSKNSDSNEKTGFADLTSDPLPYP